MQDVFSRKDFICGFHCNTFAEEIRNKVITAVEKGKMPNFSEYNDRSRGRCICSTDKCDWDENKILATLERAGVLEKCSEYLVSRGR